MNDFFHLSKGKSCCTFPKDIPGILTVLFLSFFPVLQYPRYVLYLKFGFLPEAECLGFRMLCLQNNDPTTQFLAIPFGIIVGEKTQRLTCIVT